MSVSDSPELAAFRQRIDIIDEEIIRLLIERTGIVAQVGEFKRQVAPGQCPIRPGREAEQVRRILQQFKDTPFPPAAAAALWRIIIGTSTSVEAPLTLSVFAHGQEQDFVGLARDYFGPLASVTRQPAVRRVIGDVMDGKASVGIVPLLKSDDTTYWWTNLMAQGKNVPRIFACLPFVHLETPSLNAPSALAIARLAPEPSGDDRSLMVLEAEHNVSQHRLQSAFAGLKLDALWINIATLNPDARHHLIEINGFVTADHPAIRQLAASFGEALRAIHFLGAYAVPVILAPKQNSLLLKSRPYAAISPKA